MDLLRLDSITKIFGGLTALDNVSFSVAPGSITGIIGPNGAGKTTLFNIITGLYIQTSGEVFLEEQNISFLKTEEMAPLGLVRTFQNIELFGRMTVLENVMVGMHTGSRSGMVSCALKLPGHIREEKYIREKSMEWLKFTRLEDMADMPAESLPFGKGRLLEFPERWRPVPELFSWMSRLPD